MERWSGRIALVTGASRGIGNEICRELVKHGLTVIACSKDLKTVQELAEEEDIMKSPGKLHPMECDYGKVSNIIPTFKKIKEEFGHVDICINKACRYDETTFLNAGAKYWYYWWQMLSVNVLALSMCTKESIELMVENNVDEGQIINITSFMDYTPKDPTVETTCPFYKGTQSMVRALTQGLRQEVKAIKTPIRVSNISYRNVDTGSTNVIEVPTMRWKDVAAAVVYILSSPPNVNVCDIHIQPVENVS